MIDKGQKGVLDAADEIKRPRRATVKLGTGNAEQVRIQAHVVDAANQMNDAAIDFAARNFRVNQQYWWVGYGGKMGVRFGQRPSAALADIFNNGRAYSMECATATLATFYKAILDRIGPDDFDKQFPRLQLYRWRIQAPAFEAAKRQERLGGMLPGDYTYYVNPEVAPENAAFAGENVIDVGDGLFFGHGIGIVSESELLDELDSMRSAGATKKAYRARGAQFRLDGETIAAMDEKKTD